MSRANRKLRSYERGLTSVSLVLCMLAGFIVSVSLGAGAEANTTLQIYLQHFVRPGGSWVLAETAKTLPTSSTRWVQNYRWGPGKTSAYVDTYSLSEDGICELVWHTFYRWDVSTQAIKVEHVGPGDAYLAGVATMTTLTLGHLTLQGTLPNGVVAQVRDVRDRSEPRVYTALAHSWNADARAWEPSGSDPAEWRFGKRHCHE